MYRGKTDATLGLNSVGHVNHSAIYLAIVFGASLSFVISYMGRVGHAVSLLSGLATGVLIVSVFVTESRAAIGAAAAFAVVFAGVLGARKRTGAVKGTLVPLLGVAVILAVKPGVLDKTLDKTEQGLALSYRNKIALAKSLPRVQDTPLDWTLFGAALAGWLVTAAVGLVNTTLHHEHGILAALLLGLWLSRRTVSGPTAQGAP
jgi:hypothetical protein